MDGAKRWLWPAPLVVALLIAGTPGKSAADTVRMKDGSVIHGEVLKIKDDKLIIDTVYADEVSIEVEHIVGIDTDRSFTIQYDNGSRQSGQISISPEGRLVVTEKTTDASVKEAPASTPGIETPVEDVALGPPIIDVNDIRWMKQRETYYRYIAELNIGLAAARGNTNTTDFHFDALMEPSFGLNTIALSGEYDREEADGDTTTNQWMAQGAYRRRFKRRWYAFGTNRWEADAQRDLELRILTGAGPGYYFYEDAPTWLSLQGGVAYVVEDFQGDTSDRNFAAYMWTTDFERDLYKDDITFYHDHNFVGSFEDPNNFLIQTATGLTLDIWGGFNLSAEVQFDWTNDPADGKDQDDTRYILKFGYEVEGDESDWWQ